MIVIQKYNELLLKLLTIIFFHILILVAYHRNSLGSLILPHQRTTLIEDNN